ncbi:MAG: hypothetical protein AAF585_13350, partial [Verrucomicrobiota bacterium]
VNGMKILNRCASVFIAASVLTASLQAEPESKIQLPATALAALEDPEKLAYLRGGVQHSRALFEISRTRYDLSTALLENEVSELEAMSVDEFLKLASEKAAWVEVRVECDVEFEEPAAFKEADEIPEPEEDERDLLGFENPFLTEGFFPDPDSPSLLSWIERFARDQGLRADVGLRVVRLVPDDSPETLYTAVYRVPAAFLGGFGPNDPGCFPEAPHRNTVFEMRYADVVFEEAGIPFSNGAGAWFDPRRSRVVVQQNISNLELVETYVNTLNAEARKLVRVQTDLYALPVAFALDLKKRFRGASAHNEMVDAIYEAMTENDGIQILASLSAIASSGQRAKTEAHVETELVTKYEVLQGKETAVTETFTFGHQFEIDPVIGLDGLSADVNLNPEFQLGEPIITTREIAGPVSGLQLQISEVERAVARFSVSTQMESGQTQLLGTVTKDLGNGPRILMCFASVDVVLTNR